MEIHRKIKRTNIKKSKKKIFLLLGFHSNKLHNYSESVKRTECLSAGKSWSKFSLQNVRNSLAIVLRRSLIG